MPMLILAALAAATVTAPQPGEIKSFKDWVIACDNILSCTAETPMSEDGDAAGDANQDPQEEYHQIALTRTGRASSPIVIDAAVEPEKGAAVLMVDGAVVQSLGNVTRGGVSSALTSTTLAKMAQGQGLEIRVAGKVVASGSLAGFSAAMRYCDAAQRRDGGPDAIVAKGRTARSVLPPTAPRIVAARVPQSNVPVPDAATIAMLAKKFGCDERDGPMTEAHALGGGRTLILLPCQGGPYNTWSKPVIAAGKNYSLAPFDLAPDGDVLVDGGFDAKTASLSSFEKDRGGGACGRGQGWVWDGTRFRLTDMEQMIDCTGSSDEMRTWIATVVR